MTTTTQRSGRPAATDDTTGDGAAARLRRMLPGRGSRRRVVVGAAAAVVLVLLVGWAVAFSPLLGARTVTVRGATVVPASVVLRAADVTHGTPLLRLDTAAVQHRVEQLPGIASAEVTTSFPSTVVISVDERVAVGVVVHGAGFELVDESGRQYRAVTRRPDHLPLFVLPSGPSAQATGHAVATVAAALPPAVRARLQSVQALDPSSITLLMRSGRVVHWGDAERTAEKARDVVALLQRRSQQIDVSDPDQPFTR